MNGRTKLLLAGLVIGWIGCGGSVTEIDTDRDGLSDQDEHALGTSAERQDSDGDGVNDGVELENGSDPLDDQRGGAQDTGNGGGETGSGGGQDSGNGGGETGSGGGQDSGSGGGQDSGNGQGG
ncbi:MAG: hypothetical protein IPG45_26145 [Deltaproteobacteria bacterium]|nr:hypothetical protein [Deltaproteobacteria bacterium]